MLQLSVTTKAGNPISPVDTINTMKNKIETKRSDDKLAALEASIEYTQALTDFCLEMGRTPTLLEKRKIRKTLKSAETEVAE